MYVKEDGTAALVEYLRLDGTTGIAGIVASKTITVPNTGLIVGTSTPFSDAAGTLTLQNIDALDATTIATIDAAISPALTPWTSSIDADDNDLTDGGTFEIDGIMATTDNTLTMDFAAGRAKLIVDDDDGTGPILRFYHDSASPVDGDVIAQIDFDGEDDTAAENTYATIKVEIQDIELGPPSSTESIMRFYVNSDGSNVEFLRLDGTDGVDQVYASKQVNASAGLTCNDQDLTNVGAGYFDSINADNASVDYMDVNILEITQEDVNGETPSCTTGQLRLDTGGDTVELCYCQTTNTWLCAAMTAGPTD